MATTSKKNAKKKSTRKKGEPRENPVSLAPVEFEEALKRLLAVKPDPETKRKPEKEERKKPASK